MDNIQFLQKHILADGQRVEGFVMPRLEVHNRIFQFLISSRHLIIILLYNYYIITY